MSEPILGKNTGITMSVAGALATFIVGCLLYVREVEKDIQQELKAYKIEIRAEMKEQYVKMSEYAVLTTKMDAMVTSLSKMDGNVAEINNKLEEVRIKDKRN